MNFIVKKITLAVALIAMVIVPQVTLAANGAVVHKTERFLTGTMLVVTNLSPYTALTSNQWYYSYTAGTNVQGGATNATGMTYPGPVTTCPLAPNANGDLNTTYAIQWVVGYTNGNSTYGKLFYPPGFTPTGLNAVWTNPAPPAMFASTGTNTVTVVVAPRESAEFGVPFATTYAGLKTFTFSFAVTNGVPNIGSTNISSSLLQGASGLTILSITATNATTAGGAAVINGLNLVGWVP